MAPYLMLALGGPTGGESGEVAFDAIKASRRCELVDVILPCCQAGPTSLPTQPRPI